MGKNKQYFARGFSFDQSTLPDENEIEDDLQVELAEVEAGERFIHLTSTAEELARLDLTSLNSLYLYRSPDGVHFDEVNVSVSPYFIGLWLGDGSRKHSTIYNFHETEVIDFLREYALSLDLFLSWQGRLSYAIVGKEPSANKVWPNERPPEGRDPVRDHPRMARKTLIQTRRANGWTLLPFQPGKRRQWIPPAAQGELPSSPPSTPGKATAEDSSPPASRPDSRLSSRTEMSDSEDEIQTPRPKRNLTLTNSDLSGAIRSRRRLDDPQSLNMLSSLSIDDALSTKESDVLSQAGSFSDDSIPAPVGIAANPQLPEEIDEELEDNLDDDFAYLETESAAEDPAIDMEGSDMEDSDSESELEIDLQGPNGEVPRTGVRNENDIIEGRRRIRRLHREGGLGDLRDEEMDELVGEVLNDEEGALESKKNVLLRRLRELGILAPYGAKGPETDRKRIPDCYLFNSRAVRLQVLAGFIDSDGSYDYVGSWYTISQSELWHTKLFDDLLRLIGSLGFSTSVGRYMDSYRKDGSEKWYRRVRLTGDLESIPCLLGRKIASHRYKPVTSAWSIKTIKLEKVKRQWYGFAVSGDRKFLRSDFLVLHNSGFEESMKFKSSLSLNCPPSASGLALTIRVDQCATARSITDPESSIHDVVVADHQSSQRLRKLNLSLSTVLPGFWHSGGPSEGRAQAYLIGWFPGPARSHWVLHARQDPHAQDLPHPALPCPLVAEDVSRSFERRVLTAATSLSSWTFAKSSIKRWKRFRLRPFRRRRSTRESRTR